MRKLATIAVVLLAATACNRGGPDASAGTSAAAANTVDLTYQVLVNVDRGLTVAPSDVIGLSITVGLPDGNLQQAGATVVPNEHTEPAPWTAWTLDAHAVPGTLVQLSAQNLGTLGSVICRIRTGAATIAEVESAASHGIASCVGRVAGG